MDLKQLSKSQIRGQIIKDYRHTHNLEQPLTQGGLAGLLHKGDDRTIREWESGRVLNIQFSNQRDLHQQIGIPLELLGTEAPLMPEEVVQLHQRLFPLLERGAYISAYATSNLLIKAYQMAGKNDPQMPGFILPAAYHIKGMTTSTLIDQPRQTLPIYRDMLKEARELNDMYAVALALTHIGDTYRRQGKLDEACKILEEAMALFQNKTLTGKNARVLGNCQQLYARVLRRMGKSKGTFEYLQKAREMAEASLSDLSEGERDYYLCFCPLSVQSEYVRTLMMAKRFSTGFDELDKLTAMAEKAPLRWAIPILIKEGEFKTHLGRRNNEDNLIKEGEKSLIQGYKLADKHAHLRKKQYVRRLLKHYTEIDMLRLERQQELNEKLDKIDEEGANGTGKEDSGE